MSKRDKYVTRTRLQPDELDQQLAALSGQAGDAGTPLAQRLDGLQADSRAAAAKLEEVKAASEDGWHKLVSEMERLRRAFSASFSGVRSRA